MKGACWALCSVALVSCAVAAAQRCRRFRPSARRWHFSGSLAFFVRVPARCCWADGLCGLYGLLVSGAARMALSKAYALLSLSYILCGARRSCCPAGASRSRGRGWRVSG